jgi:hypothetical protein
LITLFTVVTLIVEQSIIHGAARVRLQS